MECHRILNSLTPRYPHKRGNLSANFLRIRYIYSWLTLSCVCLWSLTIYDWMHSISIWNTNAFLLHPECIRAGFGSCPILLPSRSKISGRRVPTFHSPRFSKNHPWPQFGSLKRPGVYDVERNQTRRLRVFNSICWVTEKNSKAASAGRSVSRNGDHERNNYITRFYCRRVIAFSSAAICFLSLLLHAFGARRMQHRRPCICAANWTHVLPKQHWHQLTVHYSLSKFTETLQLCK